MVSYEQKLLLNTCVLYITHLILFANAILAGMLMLGYLGYRFFIKIKNKNECNTTLCRPYKFN